MLDDLGERGNAGSGRLTCCLEASIVGISSCRVASARERFSGLLADERKYALANHRRQRSS